MRVSVVEKYGADIGKKYKGATPPHYAMRPIG